VDSQQKLSGEIYRNGALSLRSAFSNMRKATMADKAADIDHVWKLVEDIPVAMVVTHEGQGQNMRARPMAARPAKEEGAIYFLTDADTPKAQEIRRNQSVCLAFADNKAQKYVSISGHAEMLDDRERVKKYWSVYDKAFWPDKNDPRIRVLRVTPESAEFWEGDGRVVTAVKLVAAIASGERMNVGENEKVALSQGGRLAD
jgi:general stress protein 26